MGNRPDPISPTRSSDQRHGCTRSLPLDWHHSLQRLLDRLLRVEANTLVLNLEIGRELPHDGRVSGGLTSEDRRNLRRLRSPRGHGPLSAARWITPPRTSRHLATCSSLTTMRSTGAPTSPSASRRRTNSALRLFRVGSTTSRSRSLFDPARPVAWEPKRMTWASALAAPARRCPTSRITDSSTIVRQGSARSGTHRSIPCPEICPQLGNLYRTQPNSLDGIVPERPGSSSNFAFVMKGSAVQIRASASLALDPGLGR
jgi:hypothetical protein